MKTITQLGLTFARFAISGWVMAAALFVAITIAQVLSKDLGSETLDRISVIKFPLYYLFGVTLLTVSLSGTLLALVGKSISKTVGIFCAGLIGLALVMMVVDYYQIYLPLVDLITPPGKARTAEFQSYHNASELINEVGLVICLVAAFVLCWTKPLATLK